MHILILTQYFPPETGAPQNRLFELALRLKKQGVKITVLTAMPNYPHYKIFDGYKGKWYHFEEIENIPVHRAWIYARKSKGIVSRLLNYFSFVFSSLLVSRKIKDKFDFVFFESPPLFLGISAWIIARLRNAGMIMNVSDLWPESAEKLNIVNNRFFLQAAYKLEAALYRASVLVTGQTQGIVKDIRSRFPLTKVFWLKNGVDLNMYDPKTENGIEWRTSNGFSSEDFLVTYAGILGYAQGLEVLVKAGQLLSAYPEVKIVIVGDGPEKAKIQSLVREGSVNQVIMLPSVGKKDMIRVIAGSDVAVVPLRKLDLFLGAIPSKIFENLAMEKPVLLGVDGEARDLFIEQGNAGLFFEPENPDDLAKGILALYQDPSRLKDLGRNGRTFVQREFNRDVIAMDFLTALRGLSV